MGIYRVNVCGTLSHWAAVFCHRVTLNGPRPRLRQRLRVSRPRPRLNFKTKIKTFIILRFKTKNETKT